MALPVFVGQFAGSAGTSLGINVLSNIVVAPWAEAESARRSATNSRIAMASWWDKPQVPPPPSAILDAYNRKFITLDLARTVLRNQGINLGWIFADPRTDNHGIAWEGIRKGMLERPTVGMVMDVWARGFWDHNSARAKEAVEKAGGDYEALKNYVETMWRVPAVGDLIEARNRDIINQGQFITLLKRNGFGAADTRNVYNKLRERLPGPGDLIHFAVKEAFSVDIANRVGLYNEFPQEITPYMQGQGLNWELGFDITADGVIRRANVMDLYWAAHWQPISPQQAIGMYHLLRPNRLQRYRDVGIDAQEFSLIDVERWLRINDYPKSVREQLVTLSFTPLRLVDIRSALTLWWRVTTDATFAASIPADILARVRRYNRAWGIEQFRDRGVLPEDAQTQVDMIFAKAAAAASAPAVAANRSAIVESVRTIRKGYAKGILTRQGARTGLTDLGLAGAAADTFLDIEDAQRQMRRVDTAVASLRRGYLSGATQGDVAFQRLRNAGISEERAQELIDLWFSEFTANRRHATTERILKWVSQGRMSATDASLRLQNLGWDNPDLVMLVAEAEGRALTLRAQAVKAAQSGERTRLGQLDKVRRAQEQNLKAVQAAIRRQTPVTRLVAWLSKGRITKAAFLQRMADMAYPPDIAENYARDAIESVPIATLQRWLRKREINESTFRANLAAKNLTAETIEKYLEDALRIEPQHLYPKPPQGYTASSTDTLTAPAAPQPSPTQPPALPPGHPGTTPEQPTNEATGQALHTQPEVLHTVPAIALPGGGIAAPGNP